MVIGGAVLLAACEFDRVTVPPTDYQVAMHAVLSATAPTQVVLLEHTRNGTFFVGASDFPDENAIVTDEGVAETEAEVVITTPTGDRLLGIEDKFVREDRHGAGVYRFYVPGYMLLRNLPYHIHVRTALGYELDAETSIPLGVGADAPAGRTFDRSRDTLALAWDPSLGARSYYVRVETPYGPRAFFVDGTSAKLPPLLRNVDATGLPHVFIPGFPQAVTVSAVDRNFYDWFRGHANELTGEGLVNHVTGGLGVFGSLVRLRFDSLDVVAPQTTPATGRYRFVDAPIGTRYFGFDLYLESKAARADQADALSGRVFVIPRLGYTGCLTCGLLGSVKGDHVELHLLDDWTARDTVETFEGTVKGDTIVGTYRGIGGIVTFVRQR